MVGDFGVVIVVGVVVFRLLISPETVAAERDGAMRSEVMRVRMRSCIGGRLEKEEMRYDSEK